MIASGEISSRGNHALLEAPKTAFFCSRRQPASVAPRARDWAAARFREGCCVISGNHSGIERQVLSFFLGAHQPVIVALARGMMTRMDPVLREPLADGRLLVVSCFTPAVRRVTRESALVRNDFMAALAEEIFIAHAARGGNLERSFRRWIRSGKPVRTFDIPENRDLIEAGAAPL